MIQNKMPKNAEKYNCKKCNFKCSKKSNFEKHLLTAKHIMIHNDTIKMPKNAKPLNEYNCDNCGKIYKFHSGLYRHKRICTYLNDYKNEITEKPEDNDKLEKQVEHPVIDSEPDYKHMFIELIKQNSDFKSLIIEQQKENQTLQKQLIDVVKDGKTINNMTNSNNNNQFNLNFFLNNTCKDAMNMSEFINDINVNCNDIEYIGKNGYVNGMTNMILSRIRDLDVTKRPIHCTDLKRETMYIKDNNEWNKDTADKSHFRNMVKIVAKHNQYQFPIWREKHPASDDMNSATFEFSLKMIQNILGDVGEEQIKLDNKVMRNLSKHILVDKNI